jgi:hypothetical protein
MDRSSMKKVLLSLVLSVLLCGGALAQQSVEPGGGQQQPKGPPPPVVQMPEGSFNVYDTYLHIAPLKKQGSTMITIAIWGEIETGDSKRFEQALSMIPKPWDEVFIIGSNGGSLEDGLEIGRIIRKNHLATHIPKNDPGHAIGTCISACNFIFLGGVIRRIDDGGVFKVHLFHVDDGPESILEDVIDASKQGDQISPVAQDPSPSKARVTKSESNGIRSLGLGNTTEDPKPTQPYKLPDINEPANLASLGCKDLDKIYTPKYDLGTARQEVGYELKRDPDNVDLNKEHPQNVTRLQQLRAETIDYLCVEQNTAQASAEIVQFLLAMRLSVRFFDAFSQIANATPTALTREQLKSFGIINTPD